MRLTLRDTSAFPSVLADEHRRSRAVVPARYRLPAGSQPRVLLEVERIAGSKQSRV